MSTPPHPSFKWPTAIEPQRLKFVAIAILVSRIKCLKFARYSHAREGQDRAVHSCLNAKVFLLMVALLAVGTVCTAVMGCSERPLWDACLVLSAL